MRDLRQWLLPRRLLSYLAVYPDAKDTERGISRWWLGMEGGDADLRAVTLAAERLVRQGWLSSRQLSPSERLYRLDPARRMDLHRVVNDPVAPPNPVPKS